MAKEQWGSRVGIILAVAGSAVGLGNFLRFPGQVAQYGGGAFMIPYFISLILIAIPMVWAEWTMGRYGGRHGFHSTPAIFGVLGRNSVWRYMGVLGLVIPICIYMYYVYIEAWCLGYAWSYLTGDIITHMGTDPAQYAEQSTVFFKKYVGSTHDGLMMQRGSGLQPAVLFWIITFTINFVLIYRGISKGIEWFCVRAMPIMAFAAVLVLIRVLTLPANPDAPDQNVLNGLAAMWNPKPIGTDLSQPWYTALMNAEVWLAAAGQIFFSLSIGFGVIVNYSSYLTRKDDVVLSGLTAASTNEFFEVCLGGLITIPAAFIFFGMAGTTGGTFGLGFNTLPAVFMHMPEIGGVSSARIFGFLWFFMLFLAAITSSLSMLQPAIAFLEEALGVGRRISVAILGLITAGGSLFVIWFSKDLMALDTIDFWVGTALIFVLAMVQSVLFAWVFGAEKGVAEAAHGAEMRLPRLFPFIIRYVSPLYLAVVFVAWCYNNLPARIRQIKDVEATPVPLYAILVIGGLTVLLLIMIAIAGPRWRAEQADKSPARVPEI